MPGSEEKLIWKLIPIECGYIKIPKIKVVDRRKPTATGSPNEVETEGEIVRIVNVSLDRRLAQAEGPNASQEVKGAEEPMSLATVLVLPKA